MFPQPMSRSEFYPDDSRRDVTHTLEQHLAAGFPPDLALDLAVNELVVRAAPATHATAAALALVRGDEMVCRAATGHLAPDLGIPLNTRDGLSGACLETGQPQLSVDTEFDPRVDPAVSRRGIRSILIVPVFDSNGNDGNSNDGNSNAGNSNDKQARFTGILEIFSTSPAAFADADQKLLERFAEECARIRRAAIELGQRRDAAAMVPRELARPELVPPEFGPPDFMAATTPPARRTPYEGWTIALGGLAILATIAVSFLIGSRIGWLPAYHPQVPIREGISAPQKNCVGTAGPGCPAEQSLAATAASHRVNPSSSEKASTKTAAKASTRTSPTPAADELVIYEKGKVIFRMRPAPAKPGSDAIVQASSTTKIPTAENTTSPRKVATTKSTPSQSVWLSPAEAETHLLTRTEPEYPPEALAAHRAGDVVLEVQVAEDGSVANIRTLSGDPLLAAAASEAVRNWRYQPYRQHDRPAQFQTDVTLSFTLPN